ncbi:MAG: hypothetical protein C0618_12300 [Desulfuromonas sp.]|nr:MAG: hypothetical protein C0618_12300 [Desulfuromonas sp.]
MKRPHRQHTFCLLFSLILWLLSATPLYATCSPYVGFATINEINVHNQSAQSSKDSYIEIKALSPDIILSDIWESWTIDVCSAIGAAAGSGCRTDISVEDYYFDENGDMIPNDPGNNGWLVTPESTFNWPYIDLNASKNNDPRGMTVTLYDENGLIIDVLDVDGYASSPPPCSFPYDIDFPGSNDFNIQRQPDGNGDWVGSGGGNSGDQTVNDTNDPTLSDAPRVVIGDTTTTAGNDMVFTISLLDPLTSAPIVAGRNVDILYETIDGTALIGTDYVDTGGTVTIPSGASSVTLPIPTLATATNDRWFYLHLIEVTTKDNDLKVAVIGFNMAKGTISAPSVDHYEIHHDGSALTCEPEAITIKACTDTATPCALATDPSDVTLATSAGSWLETSPITFTGSTTVNLKNTDSTLTPVISLSTTTPSATVQCYENGTPDAACDLAFYDSGFLFDVLDAASGSTQTVTMQAVRLDDTTQTCTPTFTDQTKAIDFSFIYADPLTNPHGSQAQIGSIDFVGNALNHNLYFDPSGTTSFILSYPDAGSLTFTASYDDGSAVATGNDTAIFYPDSFRITAPVQTWTATDGSSTVLAKAGETFSLTIEALNTAGVATPNYTGTVTLSADNVSPATGVTGAISTTTANLTDGTATLNQTYSEVGIMTITADDLDYLGHSITGTSENIGRFIPDQFRIISGLTVDGILNHADTLFSYYGHEINGYSTAPSIIIEALAVDGSRTQNYQGDYFKMTAADIAISNPTADKVETTQPISIIRTGESLLSNGDGTMTYLFGTDGITYTKQSTATPPLSTPQFDFEVTSLTDSDPPTATAVSEMVPVSGGTEFRYGRLNAEHTYGPETEPLDIIATAEYWDGSQWQPNPLDNVSTFQYIKTETDITTVEDENGVLVAPASTDLTITSGLGTLTLTPNVDAGDPGGSVDVTLLPQGWLNFDWDNDVSTVDSGPTVTVTFGIYRGRDRIISWEEIPVH